MRVLSAWSSIIFICGRATAASPFLSSVIGAAPAWSLMAVPPVMPARIDSCARPGHVLDSPHCRGQRLGAVGVFQRFGAADEPLAPHLQQVLVERLHAALAAFDVLAELREFSLEDVLLGDRAAPQDLDRRSPPAARLL